MPSGMPERVKLGMTLLQVACTRPSACTVSTGAGVGAGVGSAVASGAGSGVTSGAGSSAGSGATQNHRSALSSGALWARSFSSISAGFSTLPGSSRDTRTTYLPSAKAVSSGSSVSPERDLSSISLTCTGFFALMYSFSSPLSSASVSCRVPPSFAPSRSNQASASSGSSAGCSVWGCSA